MYNNTVQLIPQVLFLFSSKDLHEPSDSTQLSRGCKSLEILFTHICLCPFILSVSITLLFFALLFLLSTPHQQPVLINNSASVWAFVCNIILHDAKQEEEEKHKTFLKGQLCLNIGKQCFFQSFTFAKWFCRNHRLCTYTEFSLPQGLVSQTQPCCKL